MSSTTQLRILHFNDVYRVLQTSSKGTISADQFAAKIARIRTKDWGESEGRALDFLESLGVQGDDNDGGEANGAASHASTSRQQTPRQRPDLHGLTLFSGDALNPSIESSVTRGAHMVEVLNAMSIDCACIGNHDFDFGWPHLGKMMRQCNFPWMLSNIADVGKEDGSNDEEPQQGDKIADGTLPHCVFTVQGVRVGCIGLVEKDWIATVPAFPPTFRYRSMVHIAKSMSKELRDPSGEHRCDIVIALTHCRLPNDIDLANDLGAVQGGSDDQGVDLVLGGHDHTYYVGHGVKEYEGEDWRNSMPGQDRDKTCMVVKSGTDFHDLSEITLELSEPDDKATRRRRIVNAKVRRHTTVPDDETLPELKSHIDELMQRVDNATGEPVAFSLTPLDCRMDKVRAEESPVGNFIADILMHSYDQSLRERDERGELDDPQRPKEQRQVDMAFICGGSLRGDSVFGPGILTLRDVLSIMPFEDSVIVRRLKGSDILEALENALGAYPSLEGRFPQISGLYIAWDSRKPKGQRLVEVRMLDDVHLFSDDGKRNTQQPARRTSLDDSGTATPPNSEGQESYVFQRSEEGGYSIEVNKPRIRKGPRLDPDAIYRVCTREYMGDGHDGYEALTRAQGPDIVDHENGALMSTQVRKFLLGASLIWRLKTFRDQSDERGRGVVESSISDHTSDNSLLSAKTQRAVQRAHALSSGESPSGKGETNGFSTPKKSSAGGIDRVKSMRMVVDSSPGGIRDAMHVGASEHHSAYDAASKTFHGSRKKRRPRATSNGASAGDESMDASWMSSTDDDARSHQMSASTASIGGKLPQDITDGSATTHQSSNGSALAKSPTDGKPTFQRHIQVSAQDGQALREAANDLAIIVPLQDGRLVDVARRQEQ